MKTYSRDEVATHCTEGDLWIIVGKKVYDVSEFAHPGGINSLLKWGGKDASKQFVSVKSHRSNVDKMISNQKKCVIGTISD